MNKQDKRNTRHSIYIMENIKVGDVVYYEDIVCHKNGIYKIKQGIINSIDYECSTRMGNNDPFCEKHCIGKIGIDGDHYFSMCRMEDREPENGGRNYCVIREINQFIDIKEFSV